MQLRGISGLFEYHVVNNDAVIVGRVGPHKNYDIVDKSLVDLPRCVVERRQGALIVQQGIRLSAARAAVLALICVVPWVASGCAGDDAVAQGGTFQFVSPGGLTVITYDPPASRQSIAQVSGPDVVTDQNIGLDDFAGKVVVINVWGSWCGPCRGEADDLEYVYEQTKASGVEFLGINLRDNRQAARDFIVDRKVAFPSIYDFAGVTLAALTTPTSVVPTTIVLDREHRPAAVFLKAITADELGTTVKRVVAEPTAQQQ